MNQSHLADNYKILMKRCEDGLRGKYKVNLGELIMIITNVCNAHCVMCPNIRWDAQKSQTYLNEAPWTLSYDEYKSKYLPPKRFMDQFRRGAKDFYNQNITVRFDQGETFSNPDHYKIIQHTKETLPNSSIVILTNGSVEPLNYDIVKYLSVLAFSIDGASAETFEHIRKPLKFNKVVDIMKKFSKAKEAAQLNTMLRITTCLSGMNIHELPDIIKLASDIGGFESVYTNPLMIMDHMPQGQKELLAPYQLERLDYEVVHKYVSLAYEMAEKTGVRLDAPEGVKRFLNPKPETKEDNATDFVEYDTSMHRYCTKVWHGIIKYDEEGLFSRWCGNIAKEPSVEIIEKYKIPRTGKPWDILNSKGFFQYRKDMLEGKCLEYCEGCRVGTHWANELVQTEGVSEKWVTS